MKDKTNSLMKNYFSSGGCNVKYWTRLFYLNRSPDAGAAEFLLSREQFLWMQAFISEVKLFTPTSWMCVLRGLLETLLEIALPSTLDIIIPSVWQAQRVWGIFRFLSDCRGSGFLTSTWVIKGQFSLIDIFKLIMDWERIITSGWRCEVDSINFLSFLPESFLICEKMCKMLFNCCTVCHI